MKRILNHLATDWYKYLLELIVITAGVIGAFALNSWKEQRELDDQKMIVLGFIKEDIRGDIAEIDSALIGFRKSLTTMEEIVSGNVSKELYTSDGELYISSFLGYEDLIIDQRGLNLLNNSLDLKDRESTELANKIAQFYSDHIIELQVASEELSNNFQRLYVDHSQEDWFFEFNFKDNVMPFAQYATNNRDFQKQIGSYLIIYQIYVNELNRFRENGTLLISEIDDYLNK